MPLFLTLLFIAIVIYFIFKLNKGSKYNAAKTIEDKYNAQRTDRRKHMDELLEKIHQKGMNSLTANEKEKLQEYSKMADL